MSSFLSKYILVLWILLASTTSALAAQDTTNFYSDIPANHWAMNSILEVAHHPIGSKLMKGNPDGTFAPDRLVNRAEMAKIAAEYNQFITSDQVPTSAIATFKDTPQEAWYTPYVNTAASYGIIGGYKNSDGSPTGIYGPSDTLTIAQAIKILVEVGKLDSREHINFMYDDVRPNDWFYPYMKKAVGTQILTAEKNIKGETNRHIDPNRPITRAELAVLLQKFLNRTLQEDHTSAEKGFTLTFNPSAFYYKNLPKHIELRFPSWFGIIEEHDGIYSFKKLPGSALIFASLEELSSALIPDQVAILEQIARKEINPTLLETVKNNFTFYTAPNTQTLQVLPLSFTQKTGFEQIIYVGLRPELKDYYLRSLLVRDTRVVFIHVPLFPTSLSNYDALNAAFLEQQKAANYLAQFHFGLLQKLEGNKEALDFLSSSEVKLLQDRVDQIRALSKSASIHTD